MTAVASPPTFPQINRPWGANATSNGLTSVNPDEVRGMFIPRKTMQRTNSSSSISSNSSVSSTSTAVSSNSTANGSSLPSSQLSDGFSAPRKRPQPKAPWQAGKGDAQSEFLRMSGGPRQPIMNGVNGAHPSSGMVTPQQMAPSNGMGRPMAEQQIPVGQPVLYLLSLNGTFERKTISVPLAPESLRIGRQTNQKTAPTPLNGYFDSKVLSRQHAEIWADRNGKIMIRDIKSSNGTFVNGTRLSQENRESEPHELSSGDHLELGIDIVNEDGKSIQHHKVAAKVEHAGPLHPSSNLLDMNFGDLDPANGSMMVPAGGMQFRGRGGSQASMAGNGRMVPAGNATNGGANGVAHQRPFWLTPITTEQIVKRLHHEMRNARLQSQDLGRTGQFIGALLSKEDVKDSEKPEAPEIPQQQQQQMVNGNSGSFRIDGRNRFSDPPAPPPQQPLPQKPDVARPHGADIPGLKRGTTERPKSHPSNTSPIRQDNVSQIIQLTEALNSAKREIDTQTAKMRDLEEALEKEREARAIAEELAKQLEDDAMTRVQSPAKPDGPDSVLDEAFEPPAEVNGVPVRESAGDDGAKDGSLPEVEKVEASANQFQAKIETMMTEMRDLKQQLESFRQRAEKAETERDVDRKSLAEMILQVRREEEARAAAEKQPRSSSKARKRSASQNDGPLQDQMPAEGSARGAQEATEPAAPGALSKAGASAVLSGLPKERLAQQSLEHLPYASMLGVVILGVGLMAYLNGWQPQPRLDR